MYNMPIEETELLDRHKLPLSCGFEFSDKEKRISSSESVISRKKRAISWRSKNDIYTQNYLHKYMNRLVRWEAHKMPRAMGSLLTSPKGLYLLPIFISRFTPLLVPAKFHDLAHEPLESFLSILWLVCIWGTCATAGVEVLRRLESPGDPSSGFCSIL